MEALASYAILDSLPEPEFDELAELASAICDAPIALVAFLDDRRAWFKSRRGVDLDEIPLDQSFCPATIGQTGVLEVEDARADPRFSHLAPVVHEPRVRFYAGHALITAEGRAIGTLCVLDHGPRRLTDSQRRSLATLARHVMKLLDGRKERLRRAMSEQAAEEAAKRYEHAGRATRDALWEWNYVTGETYYSPRWYEILGYEDQAFPMNFESWKGLCHPDDVQPTLDAVSSIARPGGKDRYEAEFRMRHADGRWIWILGRGTVAERNREGQPTLIAGINADITDRKRWESELRRSEERQRTVIETLSEGVLVFSADGTILAANEACGRILEVEPATLIGERTLEPQWRVSRADGSEFPVAEHPAFETLRTGKPVEGVLMGVRTPSDRQIWVRANARPMLDPVGAIEGVVLSIHDVTEQKSIEDALRRSESMTRAAGDLARVGGWELEVATQKIRWNEQTFRIYGIPVGPEPPLDGALGRYPEPDRLRLVGLLEEAVRTGNGFDAEFEFVGEQEEPRWVRILCRAEQADGAVVRLVGAIQCVTDQRRARAALVESEQRERRQNERWSMAAEAAGIGVWESDLVARTMVWDDMMLRIHGVTREQVEADYGLSWKLIHPDDLEAWKEDYFDAVRSGRAYSASMRILRPDGQIRFVRDAGRFLPGPNGQPAKLVGITVDITDLKEAEQSARDERTLVEAFFDSLPGVAYVLDDQGRFFRWNRNYQNLYGFSEQQMRSMSVLDILAPEDHARVKAAIGSALAMGEQTIEVTFRTGDGRRLPFFCSGTPITINGRTYIAGTGIDISGRRAAEEALRKLNESLEQRVDERTRALAERSRDLESFSYAVSHDLRAPLRAISGFAAILREEYAEALGPDGLALAGRVESNAKRMWRMLEGILAYSRLGFQEPDVFAFDLAEHVAELSAQAQADANCPDVLLVVDAEPCQVELDREALALCVRNLVHNGLKYSSGRPEASVRVTGVRREDAYHLTVQDNGIGFDMAFAPRVFQMFSRLESSESTGTGIGLALVARAVSRLGGKVDVQSEAGVGSTFRISFPIRTAETSAHVR